MNILIVGNGFDLSHWLPTKYDHFMVAMDAIENWEVSKGEMRFDDLFGSLYEKEDYFFGYTKAMYKTDEIKVSIDEIKKLKEQLKVNVWYRYFKFYRNDTETWIDLERKIEEALDCCSEFFNKVEKKIGEFSKISYLFKELSDRADDNVIKLHSREIYILRLLRILCLKKLISSSPKYVWQDIKFEKKPYTLQENDREIINNEFVNENGSYRTYNFNKAIDHLYSMLEEFIDLFNWYLANCINSLQSEELIYKKLEFKPDLIYSFNYTNTIERLYGQEKRTLNYLHGKCDPKRNNLVLGISDLKAENFRKFKAYGFTKYHQKLIKDTDYSFFHEISEDIRKLPIRRKKIVDRIYNPLPGQTIRQGNELRDEVNAIDVRLSNIKGKIFIWGHSLDISDSTYIKEIFSLNDDSQYFEVIAYFFNDKAKFSLLANLLDILGKEKVETWMKKGWLKFEENPDIAKLNGIEPVELPKMTAKAS